MFPTVKICLIFVEMQVLPEAEDLFNRESVGKMFDILDQDSQGELNFEEFKKAQKMFESHAESDTKGNFIHFSRKICLMYPLSYNGAASMDDLFAKVMISRMKECR